ncbi:MAG: hypothetical protein V1838_03420 [Patescibacteria group bacterium]
MKNRMTAYNNFGGIKDAKAKKSVASALLYNKNKDATIEEWKVKNFLKKEVGDIAEESDKVKLSKEGRKIKKYGVKSQIKEMKKIMKEQTEVGLPKDMEFEKTIAEHNRNRNIYYQRQAREEAALKEAAGTSVKTSIFGGQGSTSVMDDRPAETSASRAATNDQAVEGAGEGTDDSGRGNAGVPAINETGNAAAVPDVSGDTTDTKGVMQVRGLNSGKDTDNQKAKNNKDKDTGLPDTSQVDNGLPLGE